MAVETEALGALLRRHRRYADLTQEELAERAGVSARSVSDIERGLQQHPHASTLRRLVDALELSSADRTALMNVARGHPEARPTLLSHLLPVPPTSLVGREREVADVQMLLARPGAHLVTLTGPGGVGKTRLALEVVAHIDALASDGVHVVPLESLHDPILVAPTIARTLGLRDVPSRSTIQSLAAYLRDRQVVLLLDNFEHLLQAVGVVAGLLAACTGVKIVVTSRAALHVQGEQEYPVQPLPAPDARYLPPVQALMHYPAIDLFVQRAAAVQPDFSISPANAATVAEICARLDGLPLALELAAARTKLLLPQELLARLSGELGNSRLRILTGGARDLPGRLQTMRNTIAWSYDLLEPDAQALFRRLAVFVGGSTLDAAEAVCRVDGDEAVFEGLAELVDHSLLRAEEQPDGSMRLVMLETIREYALERLTESGELTALRRQHAGFFLRLAEEAEPRLTSNERKRWLEFLGPELGNMRAALTWCQSEPSATETWLRLASALGWFWYHSGHQREGRRWVEAALARTNTTERTPARAKALSSAGGFAWLHGDYAAAQARLGEALDILGEHGDRRRRAYSLTWLGMTVMVRSGDPEVARRAFDQSLALVDEMGDRWTEAYIRYHLGNAMQRSGEYELARSSYQRSLKLFRALDDLWGISLNLFSLGALARAGDDYSTAEQLYDECLSILRGTGDKWTLVEALGASCDVALQRRDMDRARALCAEGLHLGRELSNTFGLLVCCLGAAGVAVADGQPERAARLLAASDALLTSIDARLWPADRSAYDRYCVAAQAQLGESALRAPGEGMELDQLVAYALEGLS